MRDFEVFIDVPDFELGSDSLSIEQTNSDGRLFSPIEQLQDAGFRTHHRAKEGESAFQMACRLLKKMSDKLEKAELPLKNMDALVYATCLPINANIGKEEDYNKNKDIKHLIDYPASHLQAEFGMEKAFVIGLDQQACTSMLGAIRLAANYLAVEKDLNSFLCITADRFPQDAKYEQSYNLISDGAAGVVVSRKEAGYRYLSSHQITNGAMARASDDETVGHYFNYSKMVIDQALEKAGLSIGDIDHIVPQNTNKVAWQILSSVLGVSLEKVHMLAIGDVAHVISGDNIINLKYLEDKNLLKSGDKLLLLMAGFGLNWQCLILEKV